MCSKAEWKACAERRLAEIVALRILLTEIETLARQLPGIQDFDTVTKILERIQVAKEIGK